MNLYNSYHVFMFPFKWNNPNTENWLFHNQTSLESISYNKNSNWKRVVTQDDVNDKNSLYNEKNYFYEFVHPALYDAGETGTLIHHFERVEPKEECVDYIIKCKGYGWSEEYILKVEAINLNLYSTGVGVLTFYLANDKYDSAEDILRINQYGRRMYPPYYKDIEYRKEIAEYIKIEGLRGGSFFEDFNNYTLEQMNTPSCIIRNLISDIAPMITIKSVIDDRMYVVSWYRNEDLANKFKKYERIEESSLITDDFWYRFVFVDGAMMTCQDKEMRDKLIKDSSYTRWQGWASMYGASRYSFVMLSNAGESEKYLYDYIETTYTRMAELCLVQRATVLRFSSEVTILSNLVLTDKQLSKKISSLYQEYIRFVNQIHFREVSAQDQGIEIYNLLYNQVGIKEHVGKLDKEIEELHNHLSIKEDRKSNQEMAILSTFATISVPASLVAGIYGMNEEIQFLKCSLPSILIITSTIISIILFIIMRRHRNNNYN